MEGDDFLIVGGYESGVDAAVHLAAAGKKVRVLDRDAAWLREDSNPSVTLSPFTRERLNGLLSTGRIRAEGEAEIVEVRVARRGLRTKYEAITRMGKSFVSATRPILATGFEGRSAGPTVFRGPPKSRSFPTRVAHGRQNAPLRVRSRAIAHGRGLLARRDVTDGNDVAAAVLR